MADLGVGSGIYTTNGNAGPALKLSLGTEIKPFDSVPAFFELNASTTVSSFGAGASWVTARGRWTQCMNSICASEFLGGGGILAVDRSKARVGAAFVMGVDISWSDSPVSIGVSSVMGAGVMYVGTGVTLSFPWL